MCSKVIQPAARRELERSPQPTVNNFAAAPAKKSFSPNLRPVTVRAGHIAPRRSRSVVASPLLRERKQVRADVKTIFIPAIIHPKLNAGKEPFKCGVRSTPADCADCTDFFFLICVIREICG